MSFSQVVRNEIEEERHLHLDLKNYCYICVQMKYSTQLACSTSYHDHLKRDNHLQLYEGQGHDLGFEEISFLLKR